MRACAKLLPLVERVAEKGNKNSISDAGVAAMALKTAVGGAYLNVLTNLPGISDEKYAKASTAEARKLMDEVSDAAPRIASSIEKGLGA
jgi:glutamate formiminotransferase/formiminotetrahydrofolate cyclodeaminase